MTGKLLGRLANYGSRSCSCCDFTKPKRSWKRGERKQWLRDEDVR